MNSNENAFGNSHREYFNKHFTMATHLDINKMSGVRKRRVYFKPDKEISALHEDIKARIRNSCFDILHGSGGFHVSVVNNLLDHRRMGFRSKTYFFPRYFYSVDIKSAFRNVNPENLSKSLSRFFANTQDDELKKYCFNPDGGLIVGAPASPLLFFLNCEYQMDHRLRKFCESNKIVYTRYADDLLFSSNGRFSNHIRRVLLKIIRDEGLPINYQKTKRYDLSKGPICINGVMVENQNNEGRLFIPGHQQKRLRGMLWTALYSQDATISMNQIGGEMNTFLHIMKEHWWKLTKTEEDILRLYHEYKKRLKKSLTQR